MNMIQVNFQALSHPSQTYLFSYLTQCPIIKLMSKQAGIINRFEFPLMMDDLAEKTMVFKVKWQPRWKSCSVALILWYDYYISLFIG
jgi:hypothetical protein